MSPILRLVLVGVCTVLTATACSSEASVEEYFTMLEDVTVRLDDQLDSVEAEFNAGLLDIDFETAGAESALIALFQSSITTTAESFGTLVEELRALEPPDPVSASHDDAVSAGERVIEAYEERSDELSAISELADIDDYARSLSDTGVRPRFTEACQELQVIAAQEEVPVELGC